MKDETLIYELFSVCDKYVNIEDFVAFEKEFADIVKKAGMDFYQIYYNEPFDSLKKKYKRYNSIPKEEFVNNQ